MPRNARLLFAIRERNRALAGRRPRKRKRRRAKAPTAIEIDYLSDLLRILSRARELVARYLMPELPGLAVQAAPRRDAARADAYVDVLDLIFARITAELEATGPRDSDLRETARGVARQVDAFNSRQVSTSIRESLGVDIVGTVPGLEDKVAVFARQNAQLIKSLPEDYLYDVEQTVLRAFREGKRAEEIAGQLEDRFGVAQNRAALIARDQVGKLNGEINEVRQSALGIDTYIWNNVGDERVAGNPDGKYPDAEPSHWHRQGKRYKWSSPPEGGHPGYRPQCRCWAEPDLEALLGA